MDKCISSWSNIGSPLIRNSDLQKYGMDSWKVTSLRIYNFLDLGSHTYILLYYSHAPQLDISELFYLDLISVMFSHGYETKHVQPNIFGDMSVSKALFGRQDIGVSKSRPQKALYSLDRLLLIQCPPKIFGNIGNRHQ